MRSTLVAAFLVLAAALITPAAAEAIRFAPGLPGWTVVTFPRIAPAQFAATDDGALAISTDTAAGMLWRPLTGPAREARKARWRWRVDEGVAATDLMRRGADDRAIGLYFVFSDRPEPAATPMETLTSPAVTTLVYVFGGDRPRGSVIASPHMGGRGKFIALRAADASKRVWHDESVDLASDYTRAFGRSMPALIGVAISSDSDDTRARNRARVQGLVVE